MKKAILLLLIVTLIGSALFVVLLSSQKDPSSVPLIKPAVALYLFAFLFLFLLSIRTKLRPLLTWNFLFSFLFVLLLVIPMALTLINDSEGKVDLIENRKLGARPRLPRSVMDLYRFPMRFTEYVDDNIPFRETAIKIHNGLYLQRLHESPNKKVILGEDGWLFYTGDEKWFVIKDLVGYSLFTEDQLEKILANLKRIDELCRKGGTRFVFVIAPNKESIYPEYLPPEIVKGRARRSTQLIDFVKRTTSIPIVDLSDGLMANKTAGRLYHKTDTHWNDLGAYYGYVTLVEKIGLTPRPLESFAQGVKEGFSGGLAAGMLHTKAINEQMISLTSKDAQKARVLAEDPFNKKTAIDDPTLPTAILYGDSFYGAMGPFFAEHFRSLNSYTWWKTDDHIVTTDMKEILERKPDFFIYEMVERNIYLLENMVVKSPGPEM